MLAQLTLCEYSFTKSRMIAQTTSKEKKNYEDFTKGITADIEKAKQDIEDQKEEFEKSKAVRKNKMEYEVLAHTISEHASRDRTSEDLDDINDDLSALLVSILFIDIIVRVYIMLLGYLTVYLIKNGLIVASVDRPTRDVCC